MWTNPPVRQIGRIADLCSGAARRARHRDVPSSIPPSPRINKWPHQGHLFFWRRRCGRTRRFDKAAGLSAATRRDPFLLDEKPPSRNNPRFFAPVAQLDRVPGYELGGREFESLRARQTSEGCFGTLFIFRAPRVAASETRCVTRRGKPRSPMLS